jgi:hypothetical protein
VPKDTFLDVVSIEGSYQFAAYECGHLRGCLKLLAVVVKALLYEYKFDG